MSYVYFDYFCLIILCKCNSLQTRMAPPNQPSEPNAPPKREVQPLPIPTVGVGKEQVFYFT